MSKLRRFERLAALDPLELEKRIAQDEEEEEEEDQDGDNNDRSHNSEKDERDVKSVAALDNENREEFVKKVLIPLDGHHLHLQIQSNAKRLLLDLAEEETQEGIVDREALVKRVCKKIEWWRSVQSNTIDMTVESDFRRERHVWLRNPKEVQEIVIKVELVILGSLVDELLTELN